MKNENILISSHLLYIFKNALPNICPRSLDPIYIVTCFMKWGKTSWTYSKIGDVCRLTATPNTLAYSLCR